MIERIKKIFLADKGFSLLEVLLAMFILTMALGGIVGLLSTALASSAVSNNRMVASFLAQEGIEIVKNIRDLRYLTLGSWDTWYINPEYYPGPAWSNGQSGQYRVEYSYGYFRAGDEPYLKFYKPAGVSFGYYQYSEGSDTPFKRKILLTKISDNEMKVVSEVTWIEKGSTKIATIEDRLWNWR